jgi:uncharacterized cupredoxin-like copper-binding protein
VLLAGLSTGHKIGLAVVAAVFIGFALFSSFVAPRRRPDFPGRNGMGPFIVVSFALFAAMLAAVIVFGVESEAEGAGEPAKTGAPAHAIAVTETEFKIQLPSTSTLSGGEYTFEVKNSGKIEHDLAVKGPGISGVSKTALIPPGGSAKLTVPLKTGTYKLYCSVPGHEAAGMAAKLAVG